MGSFPETYSDPKSLGKCYTTIDCDSEKTGFLTSWLKIHQRRSFPRPTRSGNRALRLRLGGNG